jgi:hypothetical protein
VPRFWQTGKWRQKFGEFPSRRIFARFRDIGIAKNSLARFRQAHLYLPREHFALVALSNGLPGNLSGGRRTDASKFRPMIPHPESSGFLLL